MQDELKCQGVGSFLSLADFHKVKMVVGTILDVSRNEKAKKPAYVMKIDFGPEGIKTTSAQLTDNYQMQELVGHQVVAVMNFPPKKVADITSEVLVLAAVSQKEGTVLIGPKTTVSNGSVIQ